MNNLYRILTNKGYSVEHVDEILWRIAHRLPIRTEELGEVIDYLEKYTEWNFIHNQNFGIRENI